MRRVEDRRHLTGQGLFVDDIERPWMLYAAFARSSVAAAKIREVSVEDALKVPGVETVITASDLDGISGLEPVLERPEFVPVEMPLLASETVRHAGEPLAMVLADSPYAAEDGAEAVRIEYEPLQPVVSLTGALAEGARAVHEGMNGNVLLDVIDPDDSELEKILEQAPVVVDAVFDSGASRQLPWRCGPAWLNGTRGRSP
jgi:carbon-monoxide dehydrogenase large subunit